MKLVQTTEYLLLIDEESETVKYSDYVYRENFNTVARHINDNPKKLGQGCKETLAYYPLTKEAKELDLPLLPNPFGQEVDIEEEFNRVDDEKVRYSTEESLEWSAYKIGFTDGYKAAQAKR